MSDPLLAGRIAVVTGGAAGIGGGVSRRLAAEGAHVVVNDIDGELLAGTVDNIVGNGGTATAVPADIRTRAGRRRARGRGVRGRRRYCHGSVGLVQL